MRIIITQWALDAYLNMKAEQVFSVVEYLEISRPDVLLLKGYPRPVKFQNRKFWSSVQDNSGQFISHAYKMKWHQIGNGKIQLRLPVGLMEKAFLCEAYVKKNEKQEKRKLAVLKIHIQLIQENRYRECGVLI